MNIDVEVLLEILDQVIKIKRDLSHWDPVLVVQVIPAANMDLISTLRLRFVVDLDNVMESIPLNLKVSNREHVVRDGGHLPLQQFWANGLGHLTHFLGSGAGSRRWSSFRRSILNQPFDSHTKVAPGQIVHFFIELALILQLIHIEILNLTEGSQLHLEHMIEIVDHLDHLCGQLP